jgi:hypothetical protein
MQDIENRMLASYRLTQYFLLYLLRQALELDQIGKDFCANPNPFLLATDGRERLRICAERIIKDIIIDLNAEVREREDAGQPFDYKRELKSPNPIRDISRSIIPQYQKAISRGRACSFRAEWQNSADRRNEARAGRNAEGGSAE